MLQHLDVDQAVSLGNTCASDKIEDRRGGIASSTETADGGQTGIVPAVDHIVLNKIAEISLGHNGVGDVKSCEFSLHRGDLKAYIVKHPLVKRTVVLELKRAERVGDTLKCVLNRMSVIVKRIDAPLVALTVMRGVNYAVDSGITHIHIGACHIYLCSEGTASVGELAVSHAAEQIEVLLGSSVSVGALLTCLGKRSSVLAHLLCVKVANVCLAVHNELFCILIALIKVVRAVENATVGSCSQPSQVLIDGLNVLHVLLSRVGIVIAKVELTAVLLSRLIVYEYSLCRADVEISVGLRWETGVDLLFGVLLKVSVNNIVYKIACDLFHFLVFLFLFVGLFLYAAA